MKSKIDEIDYSHFIPEYEKIQTEIYFRLTNLTSGKLIQNYNDTQSSFDISLNDELWDLILSELVNYYQSYIIDLV